MKLRYVFPAIIIAVMLTIGLSACANNADKSGRDYGPAEVLNFPQYVSNVADKCDRHGHRVYVTDHRYSHSSSIAVINDPTCPGGRP